VDAFESEIEKLVQGPISATLNKLPAGQLKDELAGHFALLLKSTTEERTRLLLASTQQAQESAQQDQTSGQNDLFRNLCQSNPQFIWTADRLGRHDYYNTQWLKYTGTTLETNLDLGWLQVIHPEDRDSCATTWAQRVEDGDKYEVEVRLRREDGEYRWFLAQGIPIADQFGKTNRWYGSYTEIEVQRRLMTELVNARDQAQVASKLKSEFVANMSHELRTPMNGVLGMVEVLLRADLTPKAREYSLMIREAGQSLLAIINDVLDFSKIEAGKLEISSCDFEVISVIEGIGEILATEAEEKGLELVTFIDPEIPATLLGDPLRLRQVLVNLGGNAVKFTETGTIFCRAEKIGSQSNCVRVKFSMADSGIGISEDQSKLLFEPFTQADGSISRKYGGTGLGLSISKRLVELMGGTLTLENQVSGGSIFSFSVLFPIEVEQTKSAPAIVPGSAVLLVGVKPLTASCIRDYAHTYGVAVTPVETFDDAIKVLKTMSHTPTSLIVEATASKEVCLEFGRKVRSSAPPGAMRVAYITNQAQLVNFDQSINKLEESCLTRPMRKLDLLNCLASPNSAANTSTHTQEVDVLRVLPKLPIGKSKKTNTILVVDDNKMNQHVARLLLTDMGFGVDVVDNGIAAVSAFKTQHYDLVFLDCQMPEVDGYETCKILKQIQQRQAVNVPIIAMTANAMAGSREQCLAAGMDDYVCKPIDPSHLERMVKHWINIKEKGKTGPPLALLSEEAECEITIPFSTSVDFDQLKRKYNEKVIKQLLGMFVDSAHDEVTKMEQLLASQAYSEAEAQAHSFRGACGTICATKLQQYCKQVEMAAGSADKQQCDGLFASLKNSLKHTLSEIDQHLLEPESIS
jgi:two-component system sensor histidine kinase/response regulator